MSEQMLNELARLTKPQLSAKLAELEEHRRVVVALLRTAPRENQTKADEPQMAEGPRG